MQSSIQELSMVKKNIKNVLDLSNSMWENQRW